MENIFGHISKSNNSFKFNNINTTRIIFPMCCWCTSVECYSFHVSPHCLGLIHIIFHAYYFSISEVRDYICLCLYFSSYYNSKNSMNNDWNGTSYFNNSGIICVLMSFYTIIGCLVFNFIPTPCKSDEIWSIIIIKRIKYRFMRVTSHILDATPET